MMNLSNAIKLSSGQNNAQWSASCMMLVSDVRVSALEASETDRETVGVAGLLRPRVRASLRWLGDSRNALCKAMK